MEKVTVYAKFKQGDSIMTTKKKFTVPLSRTPLEDEIITFNGENYKITDVIHNVDKGMFEVMAEEIQFRRQTYDV